MYKKSDVIKNKILGIKWYEYVESYFGKNVIIEKCISYSKRFPNTWGGGWSNVHWAFGNAFRDLYSTMKTKFKNNGQSSFNLDEVLDQNDIDYIAKELNIKDKYKDSWERI